MPKLALKFQVLYGQSNLIEVMGTHDLVSDSGRKSGAGVPSERMIEIDLGRDCYLIYSNFTADGEVQCLKPFRSDWTSNYYSRSQAAPNDGDGGSLVRGKGSDDGYGSKKHEDGAILGTRHGTRSHQSIMHHASPPATGRPRVAGFHFRLKGWERKVHPGLPFGSIPKFSPGTIPQFPARCLINVEIQSEGTLDEPGLPNSRGDLDRLQNIEQSTVHTCSRSSYT